MVYGRLTVGDWATGPQGTGKYAFDTSYVPDKYLMGYLAERWERPDTVTCIWYLRKGVRWQNKPPVNGREVVAQDIVDSFVRAQGDTRNVFYVGPTVPDAEKLKITAVDKYTVKFVGPTPDGRMVHGEGNWNYIWPKELVTQYGNLNDWRIAVGTGPWMPVDCVTDSSILFKRNPDFFMKDPFFPQNQLPYADNLEYLVILDESTRLAALRTHKVDILGVAWDQVDPMKSTNPELLSRRVPPDYTDVLFMRTDLAPFSDKRVRQALQYAVDEPRINNEYYKGNAIILNWPIMPSLADLYTPVDKLPPDLAKMFTYDTATAKKLLSDAGFPNGLKLTVNCSSSNVRLIEKLSIIKENWAAAGIDMTIKTHEPATYTSLIFGRKYQDMAASTWGNNGLDDAFGWANGGWVGKGGASSVYNFSNVTDQVAADTYNKLMDTVDQATQDKIRRDENVREIDLAWEVITPTPYTNNFWAPWFKGYQGEVGIGPDPGENGGVSWFVWIDKNLKQKITGQKQ
jgi:peptide/nickel transport system substrate-binding protein